jgi:hypothetical protein
MRDRSMGSRVLAGAVALTLSTAGLARADDEGVENTRQLCTDREDNDADGLLDCADPDCHVFRVCADYARQAAPVVVAPGVAGVDCAEPRREIASVPKTAIGAAFLPLGVLLTAGSIPLFLRVNYTTENFTGRLTDGSGTFTTTIGVGYKCRQDRECNEIAAAAHAQDVPSLVGGVILIAAGLTAIGVGSWLLYTGLQPKRQKRRAVERDLGLLPSIGFGSQGASVSLGGKF